MPIHEATPPAGSLIAQFAQDPACHVDGFVTRSEAASSLAAFAIALFDSPVFRIERAVLAVASFTPIRYADVVALAKGDSTDFGMWQVVERTNQDLLMAVKGGPIRTWLRVDPAEDGGTDLWFGSAIVPEVDQTGKRAQIGRNYRALMGFHKFYSRTLLWAAARRVGKLSLDNQL